MGERLTRAGHIALTDFYYPEFVRHDDPQSGFAMAEATPRFSQGYWAARNRLGMLVENRSWKPYAKRVAMTLDMLRAITAEAAFHGSDWLAASLAADRQDLKLPGTEVTLETVPGTHTRVLSFPGYAYERTPSEVFGALWTHYDQSKPELWNIPLIDELKPKTVVRAPLGGYVIPAGFAQVIAERLKLHRIAFQTLAAKSGVEMETLPIPSSSGDSSTPVLSRRNRWRATWPSIRRATCCHGIQRWAPSSRAGWRRTSSFEGALRPAPLL